MKLVSYELDGGGVGAGVVVADIATLNRSGSLDARIRLSHGFMHVVAHETETL
jgi:hypothetical protein